MLNSADDLARRGFWIFPVVPGQKSPPAVKDWQTGAARNADPWVLSPRHNIGVSTSKFGIDRALVVVDVDVKVCPADESILRVEMEYGDLPETFTVSTPRGGRHLYYWHTEPVKQGVNVLGRGVDIRSGGGYVVGPGSKTADGEYKILVKAEVAQAPEWLVQACGKFKEREQAPLGAAPVALTDADLAYARERYTEYLKHDAPQAIKGNGGDTTTYHVACEGRDLGLPPQDTVALMFEHYNPRCPPGWAIERLEQKVRNAYNYGQNAPGSKNLLADFNNVAPAPEEKPYVFDMIGLYDPALAPEHIIRDVVNEHQVLLIYGATRVGKTFVVVDQACTLARGIDWHGHKTQRGCAVYVGLENYGGAKMRFAAYLQHHEFTSGKDVPVALWSQRMNLNDPKLLQQLVDHIHRLEDSCGLPCRAVYIDTLVRALGGIDENDASKMTAVLNNVEALARKFHGFVGLVAHTGKAGGDPRGSSALLSAVDAAIKVEKGRLLFEKFKDGETAPAVPFRFQHVDFGIDKFGLPVGSAVVLPGTVTDADFDMPPGVKLQPIILDRYKVLCALEQTGETLTRKAWRAACAPLEANIDSKTAGEYFSRAVTELVKEKLIVADRTAVALVKVKREDPAPDAE